MTAHYYDEEQSSPARFEHVSFFVLGKEFSFMTGSGTFSRTGLDSATKLLITACSSLRGDEALLDLGCGWGAIGLCLKAVNPGVRVMMSDVNERALLLAKKNAAALELEVDVRRSDAFERIPEQFDLILTNPPYAAGREVCYRFIDEAYDHLLPGGSLLLVARHQKGGAMLERRIRDVFGASETITKKGGFRVYKGTKKALSV